MADAAIARIERRYDQLSRQVSSIEFLREVPKYLAALDTEAPARRVLARLQRDAEGQLDSFNDTERALVGEAVGIRNRLAVDAPEIDNSDAPEPDYVSHAYGQWMHDTLASFDRLARGERRLEFALLPYSDTGDATPMGTMLIILRGRLHAAQYGEREHGMPVNQLNLRPDLDDYARQIHNVGEKHGHALRGFREQGRTLPGLAEERLRALSDALTPEPFLIGENEPEDVLADRMFRHGLEQLSLVGVMRSALAGHRLDAGEQAVFDEATAFLRRQAEVLHEDIVHRLSRGEGTSATRRALLFVGRGSLKFGIGIVSAVATALIVALVTAYLAKW